MSSQSEPNHPVVQAGNPVLKMLDERIVGGFLATYGNEGTRRSYKTYLDSFRKWVSALPADYQGFSLLAEFRSYLQNRVESSDAKRKLSSYTAMACMAVVRKYVKFLFEKGLLKTNPAESVKGFKSHSTHYRRALDRNNEVPGLFDTIDRSTLVGIRDYAMISILAYTGIRGFELVAADYGDLDSIEGRPILWIRSKAKLGKSEYVFITEEPYKALVAYLKRRTGLSAQSPLFTTDRNGSSARISVRGVRKRVDYWFERAGLKSARVTMHSLRHTAAVSALKNGADIRAVQGMLRHSNPKTTMVYLKDISRTDKPAEDAVKYNGN
jgi:site-specific recombinase XerD